MNRLGILNASSLLGAELKEALELPAAGEHEIRLLTQEPSAAGTLAEVSGAARLIELFEPTDPACDLLFVCGPPAPSAADLAAFGRPAVFVNCSADDVTAPPIVAGVNLEAASGPGPFASPHPAVVLLSLLLRPLADLHPTRAAATLLQPASVFDRGGLDELLDQARAILAFDSPPPAATLPERLAFNLLPVPGATDRLAADLRSVLASDVQLGLQLVQAGVFHGLSASLLVELSAPADAEALRERLVSAPFVELADDPESLGPVRSASASAVLVGGVEPAGEATDGFRIWAVMDHLTRGGALNAAAIGEALLSPAEGIS